MGKAKIRAKDIIVNKYKLIIIPLIIAVFSIFSVSIISYNVSKNLLLEQMKADGISLSKQASRQIVGNASSLEAVTEMLEDKIKIAGSTVIKNNQNLSNEYLIQLQDVLNIDELHWMDKNGKILYSTIDDYMGWEPYVGHPLYDFVRNDDKVLIEEIRPDAEFGVLLKYGSIKAENGSFVQVGILADNVKSLTERFSYQKIVEDLVEETNISSAMFIDQELIAIADSHKENRGKVYNNNNEFKEAFKGKISSKELYDARIGSKILEIAVPVIDQDKVMGVLVIGFSMKDVYASINTIFFTSLIITLIMLLAFLWVQNRNVIKPVIKLDKNIHEIDIENNTDYRLPIEKNDTFLGLDLSINSILDKTSTYFYQLKENKEELNAFNKEISTAYDQLSTSEEELRVRYDEIQSYTQKLENLSQKYEIAIKGTNSAVWEINVEDETIYISHEFSNIVNVPFKDKEDLNTMLTYVFLDDKEQLINEYIKTKNGEKDEIYSKIRIRDKDNKLKWILVHGKGIRDASGKLNYISGIFVDIHKLKEQEAFIEYLAYHDSLTGLPNRRSFMARLLEELSKNRPGAVMLLDLDNFKGINDMLGHVFGDMVLKKVSQLLMELDNDIFFISRFGGDEFLILITGEEDGFKIEEYAKQIISLFKNKILVQKDEVYISCSLGITTYPQDSSNIDQLIMNADMSMYKVKNLGKNNYMFFNKSMNENLKEQVEIEKVLRDAIKHEGFKLVYQPQICTHTGKIIAFEALLRLKDYNISPGVFIPVAEEKGMIVEIGRWVTKQAIAQVSEWREKGFELKPVAVNFSAKQLNDEDYIDFLKETLQQYNVSPCYIELEITESILLEKTEGIMRFLQDIKDLGLQIALDDFGTGYSSLSYLTFVPVDKIKLDKSLNDRFLEIENIKVMDSIISLAHSLNLEVIAEGIEYIEQYKRLRVGGCDYIQGYLFSKPLNVEDIEEIYNDNFIEKLS
ncbi:MAG: hypothetical protein CVV02_15425 [Firmicutes bacterium HGW-Firmicutes-7]|nr:MAG: hypothetical protein CVV02_15425 [Firmicutes bacterium HGW-Firmicutes-7]